MRTVRQGLVVAIALSTVAFTSTAMAGKGGVKGANPTAPGQAGTSPGQAGTNPGQQWNSRREGDPAALSPGQQYKQNHHSCFTAWTNVRHSWQSHSWRALDVKARSPRNVTATPQGVAAVACWCEKPTYAAYVRKRERRGATVPDLSPVPCLGEPVMARRSITSTT